MPAKSEKQRRAAGMALGAAKGKVKKRKMKGAAKQMYESMTVGQLRKYARKGY